MSTCVHKAKCWHRLARARDYARTRAHSFVAHERDAVAVTVLLLYCCLIDCCVQRQCVDLPICWFPLVVDCDETTFIQMLHLADVSIAIHS